MCKADRPSTPRRLRRLNQNSSLQQDQDSAGSEFPQKAQRKGRAPDTAHQPRTPVLRVQGAAGAARGRRLPPSSREKVVWKEFPHAEEGSKGQGMDLSCPSRQGHALPTVRGRDSGGRRMCSSRRLKRHVPAPPSHLGCLAKPGPKQTRQRCLQTSHLPPDRHPGKLALSALSRSWELGAAGGGQRLHAAGFLVD